MTKLFITKSAAITPSLEFRPVAVFEVPDQKLISFLPAHIGNKADRVTKLATAAAHKLKQSLVVDEQTFTQSLGCIAGSARGATATLESAIYSFKEKGTVSTLTSPLTTSGGIASAIANLWMMPPLAIGTSMACASFLEALLIAESFIKSKRFKRVLVAGAEAPLTDFTIAQMQALKLYSPLTTDLPCQPLAALPEAKNTLVLGEGAACFLLESEESLSETNHTPVLTLESIGTVQERDVSLTGIHPEGTSFLQSMQQALKNSSVKNFPDIIFTHAPGTGAGDTAEYNALLQLAAEYATEHIPVFCSKSIFGHTFGASAALNLACAIEALESKVASLPHAYALKEKLVNANLDHSKSTQSILINAAGFGGVVGSMLFSKTNTV